MKLTTIWIMWLVFSISAVITAWFLGLAWIILGAELLAVTGFTICLTMATPCGVTSKCDRIINKGGHMIHGTLICECVEPCTHGTSEATPMVGHYEKYATEDLSRCMHATAHEEEEDGCGSVPANCAYTRHNGLRHCYCVPIGGVVVHEEA